MGNIQMLGQVGKGANHQSAETFPPYSLSVSWSYSLATTPCKMDFLLPMNFDWTEGFTGYKGTTQLPATRSNPFATRKVLVPPSGLCGWSL
jgi:hypothetical protein